MADQDDNQITPLTASNNSIDSTNPTNPPSGYSYDSPQARSAIKQLQQFRNAQNGTPGAISSGLQAASAGINAASGALNPLTAFIQGAAAGAQIPSILAQQKRDQLQSVMDASPLSVSFPEIAQKYPNLASFPTKLAIQTIQQIAVDTAKVINAKQANIEEINAQAKATEGMQTVDSDSATAYSTAAKQAGLNIDPDDIIGMRKQDVSDFITKQGGSAASALNNEKQWALLDRVSNPSIAMRGSLLGIAGQNNARADRALSLLNMPMTTQSKAAVTQDLAAIMQGGAPHESSIRAQGYGTYWDNLKDIEMKVSENPKYLDQPGIVSQLRTSVQAIKDVDNKIINDNLDRVAISHQGIIASDPQRWERYKASIINSSVSPAPMLPSTIPDGATGKAKDGTPVIRKNGVWVSK